MIRMLGASSHCVLLHLVSRISMSASFSVQRLLVFSGMYSGNLRMGVMNAILHQQHWDC